MAGGGGEGSDCSQEINSEPSSQADQRILEVRLLLTGFRLGRPETGPTKVGDNLTGSKPFGGNPDGSR